MCSSDLARTYASPVSADGKVFLTDRNGNVVVIEEGTNLKILATNQVGEGVDATPALAGRQIFIRGEKHLFCFSNP